METVIYTFVFTLLSGVLYRLGGMGEEEREECTPWLPRWLVDSKARDVGCSLLTVGWLLLCMPLVSWWRYVLIFGCTWGALSTYWDSIFEYDNFFAHGLVIGLVTMLYCFPCHIGLVIRPIVLACGMGILHLASENVWEEEIGRGVLVLASMPLVMIGG